LVVGGDAVIGAIGDGPAYGLFRSFGRDSERALHAWIKPEEFRGDLGASAAAVAGNEVQVNGNDL